MVMVYYFYENENLLLHNLAAGCNLSITSVSRLSKAFRSKTTCNKSSTYTDVSLIDLEYTVKKVKQTDTTETINESRSCVRSI